MTRTKIATRLLSLAAALLLAACAADPSADTLNLAGGVSPNFHAAQSEAPAL